MNNYKCASCGSKVLVLPESGVVRICDCPPTTGVTADAKARMTGKSSVCSED